MYLRIFGEESEDWQNIDDSLFYDGKEENDKFDNETDDDIVLGNLTTLLDAEDENKAYDLDLPKHWRCAAHTMNLVASVDTQKAFSNLNYKKANRSAFAKAVALWNKQQRYRRSL